LKQLSLFSNQDFKAQQEQWVRMEEKPIQRLYYSIADVSKITGLKQYVLRYWETEFQELGPAKNRAGNRIYRKSDIRIIFLIKRLLYKEKYTIEGARQKLHQLKSDKNPQLQLSLSSFKIDDLIKEIRTELNELLDIIDGKNDQPKFIKQENDTKPSLKEGE
jgi:DNA-binding transcriptional MerR regulator